MISQYLTRSTTSGTPVGALLVTVFTSILEVFLLCLAGYFLAGRGILDKKTQKQLNRLNVSLFTPSLLFSKVAFFLSPAKLRELWIIPLFFVVVTCVSMSVGFVLGWLFGLKRSQRSFAMAAAMFMNSNSLPIALMQSLVVTVPGLKWGDDDNKNAMVGRALTYLVLYSTLGMILRWSYGVKLLAQADVEVVPVLVEDNEETPLLQDSSDPTSSSTLVSSGTDNSIPDIVLNKNQDTLRPGVNRRQSKFYNSFPNSPNLSRVDLPSLESEPSSTSVSTFVSTSPANSDSETDLSEHEHESNPITPLPTHNPRRRVTRQQSHVPSSGLNHFLRRTKRRLARTWVEFNEFMTVPLWAALASLFVACVRPVQHALEEHMQPVKGALASAGNCSIPLTLIVLGAYFYPPPKEEGEDEDTDHISNGAGTKGKKLTKSKSHISLLKSVGAVLRGKSPGRGGRVQKEVSRPGETKTVAIAVLSRMIITPVLLLPLMALSTRFDLHAIFDDPVFVVANVLLIASPPALTLAQITQAASGDAFERLISRTIFWAYCVVTPPTTIAYVVVGLLMSKL